jgi:hypothetical protein
MAQLFSLIWLLHTMSISERVIIRYSDGTEARIGDTVLIDEKQRGVMREVVDTPEKMKT